ncbi:uncharacterized protein LOC114524823 isoform X2 [Dendronephthya gigantea]|uniref:uncharacterized protein LOC114524823 isoform X2 n=1 Tax=Dendronephthya gigantea TaxID=151771 RepID=UPI00106C310D|nr:uncharacterized protein LOC114524823 isoform X2 [Dendronephthya gigantea]
MKQSSSSSTEDDVPLKQRVKAKTQNVVKKTNKEVRKHTVPVQPNSTKFVIPRNKKTRELLDIQGLESRDAIEILRKVKQSFHQPDNDSNYVFENVTIVHNARFNTEFSEKKQEMRQEGYAQKDLEDTFAYLYLDGWHKVRKMAKEGLRVGSSSISSLGDPKMGIYLSRFPDIVSPYSIPVRNPRYLMIFKIAKGRLKAVGERTGDGCAIEPTPNYDGHISKSFPPAHNVSLEQAFASSQYYFYEFTDDGDDLHARRPRQCCPYAAVQFSVKSSHSQYSASRSVLTQDSSHRNLPSHESRNLPALTISLINEKNHDVAALSGTNSTVDGRMYENYAKHGRTLWSGVVKNKAKILSSADLLCYSSDILPITIGGNINIKGKVPFEKLRAKFLLPLFKQLPAISTKCKAFHHGEMYLYCELRPRNTNNSKLAKLVRFFQKESLAGVVEFPESSALIYIIPTSGLSHELGLTDRHYPNMLHALILKKLPKEDIQSYKKMNKITADPTTEAVVRRDIRRELQKIEIEKLRKREQSEMSSVTNSDMEMSSVDGESDSRSEKIQLEAQDKDTLEKETVCVIQNDSESKSNHIDDAMDIMQIESTVNEIGEKETNATIEVNKDVSLAAISADFGKGLNAMDGCSNNNNEERTVHEVFKSPPRVQKHATVVDDCDVNVPQTNTVTRHFIDPRLGLKTERFLVASPTEIEPLSSDSCAGTPESSPVVKSSRLSETLPAVVQQSPSLLRDGEKDRETTLIKTGETSDHKDKVSRLSSRLMALFSQTGKRPGRSGSTTETPACFVISTASSVSPTRSTTAGSSPQFVQSQNVAKESPLTTNDYKLQRIPASAPSTSTSSPSVDRCNISSASVVNVREADMKKEKLTTRTYTTPPQTSFDTLSSHMHPSPVLIQDQPQSNSRDEHLKESPAVTSIHFQPSALTSSGPSLTSNAVVCNSTMSYSTSLNTDDSRAQLQQRLVERTCPEPSEVSTRTATYTTADTSEWSVPLVNSVQSRPHENLKSSPPPTTNTYLRQICSFLKNKTASPSPTAVNFLVSPSTSSSSASQKVDDYQPNDCEVNETFSENVPKNNNSQKEQTSSPTIKVSDTVDQCSTSRTKDRLIRTSLQTPASTTSYTPPLPREALPPPPPPPLASSCGVSNITPISTEISQDSTDLYEYGLTLSSVPGNITTQDGSDPYFRGDNMSSANSSRSSTPGIPMRGTLPQYSSTPPPPPIPPPPPPPILCVYSTPMFHQENYSTTLHYAHPYPGFQAIPVPEPLPEFQCHVAGSPGYPNFPSAATRELESTLGFGYTKQITPLWNEMPMVRSNLDPDLAVNDLDLHANSKRFAEKLDENPDDNHTLTQDRSSFGECLEGQKNEGAFPISIENTRSNFRVHTDVVSEFPGDVLKQKESGESPSKKNNASGKITPISIISSDSEIPNDRSPTPETSGYMGELNADDVLFKPDEARSKKYLEDSEMEDTRQERNTSNERKDDTGQQQTLDNLTSSKSRVIQKSEEAFSKTNFLNYSTTVMKDNDQDMYVSNVSDFLDSNDETYEVIPLSDNETIHESNKRPKRAKPKKARNEKPEVKYGDGVEIYTSSDSVKSDDDSFVDIPISEKETWRKTGKKRVGLTDLREFISIKKRKVGEVHDSEKHVTSRSHRSRMVDIVRSRTDDPAASSQANSALPEEALRKMTPLNPDSELMPERIHVAAENRCRMTSPNLGSPISTPDRSPAHNETKKKLISPEFAKRRKSSSPELERPARSPNRRDYRKYGSRYAGSSDDSRPGSSAGSRPASSASSRIGNSSSRSGNSASAQTASHVSQRYLSGRRSRKERENLNTAREQARSRSSRKVVEDYPANIPARGADEDYSQNVPADSRRERQRSLSPSGSSYTTKRDKLSSKPLSPARESRYRSRYSIKRHNARSSSNESGKCRTRSYDRNNNWSRHDDRHDAGSRARNQIDLSDETVLSQLANLEVIERIQHFVSDSIRRTCREMSGCLDKPVEKNEKEQKPFFGGIGELIYSKRDEEDSRYEKDREYRSGVEKTEKSRMGKSDDDYHGEGRRSSRHRERYSFPKTWS